jgi:hypothetical protein
MGLGRGLDGRRGTPCNDVGSTTDPRRARSSPCPWYACRCPSSARPCWSLRSLPRCWWPCRLPWTVSRLRRGIAPRRSGNGWNATCRPIPWPAVSTGRSACWTCRVCSAVTVAGSLPCRPDLLPAGAGPPAQVVLLAMGFCGPESQPLDQLGVEGLRRKCMFTFSSLSVASISLVIVAPVSSELPWLPAGRGVLTPKSRVTRCPRRL